MVMVQRKIGKKRTVYCGLIVQEISTVNLILRKWIIVKEDKETKH